MGVTKTKKTAPKTARGKNNSLLLEDLIRLESYIRAFWEFLPIPVCYVNPALNIIDAGKGFEGFSGYKGTEIIGQSLKKLFLHPQELKDIEKELINKEAVVRREVTLVTKERKEVVVNLSVAQRKDEGHISGYFFAFLGMTERKKFEQELQDKIEDLEKFQKLAVGRELKMVELKKKIEELKEESKNKGRQ